MTRARKTFTWIMIAVAAAAVGAALAGARIIRGWLPRSPIEQFTVTGAVLRRDPDPRKQSPVANARVTAKGGLTSGTARSDGSGLFHLTLRPGVLRGRLITLRFEHPGYKPLEITGPPQEQLYVARMQPLVVEPAAKAKGVPTMAKIKDVRVRYSTESHSTISAGSMVKQFEAVNKGTVPCAGQQPCSPDGRWKASLSSLPLDAGESNEFRNMRVSCIAGPCPFTRVDASDLSKPARKMVVSILNWSDTTVFLVEAEVTRTAVTEVIRHSYPFITEQTMSFALPAAAEGLSFEAFLNGQEIVFPLGPNLLLSWAACSVEIAPDRNRIYRCELKPGFQFE